MGRRSDLCQTSISIEALLEQLFSFAGRAKPDLALMRRIDAAQGQLHRKFRSIHIAGTNGKGSVSHKIARALQVEGYKVGLYTSPHIASFCERIRVNGEKIPEEAVARLLPPILKMGEGTFFEYATALAFAYFAEEAVDYAVLEVGLGGRCDATNVVLPVLSIITSIHYDHMHLLGSTLEEIAQEKAGILKPGVPFVLGPRVPLSGGVRAPADESGFYDKENSLIAKSAMEILCLSENAIREGMKVRPPCRFEILKGRFILDVAHNPDGIEKLVAAAHLHFPGVKFHYISAFSRDKDALQCLKILRKSGRVTCVGGSYPRLMEPEKLAKNFPDTSFAADVKGALQTIRADEIVIVCGSFYIMDDARKSIEGLEI